MTKRAKYSGAAAQAAAEVKRTAVKLTAVLGDSVGRNDHQLNVSFCSTVQEVVNALIDAAEYGKIVVIEVYMQTELPIDEEGDLPF